LDSEPLVIPLFRFLISTVLVEVEG